MVTADAPKVWLPTVTGNLIVQPLQEESVALRALGGPITAPEAANAYAVPIIQGDPTASWLEEGQEITVSEPDLGEDRDYFHKVGGLTIISRELAKDSSPSVLAEIGRGLARDIAHRIDEAFFGARATNTLAPRGLGDTQGVTVTPTTYATLDAFTEAKISAASVGATINAWACNADTATTLAAIKTGEGSALPIMQPDPRGSATLTIAGAPLLITDTIEDGTVWGLPKAGPAQIVIREDVTVEADGSAYFSSDRVGIRAVARLTTVYPHAAAIQKLTFTE